VDADGGFHIRYTDTEGSKFRIACTLTIEQRKIDPFSNLSYLPLFSKLSFFLNSKLEISKHNIDREYYKIRGYNRNSISIILNYFNKFNLYSSKYLDYNN
jgi:hypothetical protein